jgi:hypothetical protein
VHTGSYTLLFDKLQLNPITPEVDFSVLKALGQANREI